MGDDHPDAWVGAVLTGGASRRMGRDKATLPVAGRPMAERVAAALLEAGAAEVVCIGPSVGALAAVADDEPGSGPLGAVVAALRWAAGRPVVVAACDLVAPDPRALAALAAAATASSGAVVPVVEGRRQPLVALYSASALAPLAAAYAHGERSINRALEAVDVAEVHDIDPAALADADEPGDLPG